MGALLVHNSGKYGLISTKLVTKKLCHKATPHAILGAHRATVIIIIIKQENNEWRIVKD